MRIEEMVHAVGFLLVQQASLARFLQLLYSELQYSQLRKPEPGCRAGYTASHLCALPHQIPALRARLKHLV